MAETPIYVVHLRRPNLSDPREQRTDPFYEFGSFGCTGCHSKNLMNRAKAERLNGARLAFAQGGPLGFRLVCLTPPIIVKYRGERVEASWSPAEMPFRYQHAPVLAWNERRGDFPLVEHHAGATARTTVEGGFSSRFRTRSEPLDDKAGKELVKQYERLRKAARPEHIAQRYEEALPCPPPKIDIARRTTYQKLLKSLRVEQEDAKKGAASKCTRNIRVKRPRLRCS